MKVKLIFSGNFHHNNYYSTNIQILSGSGSFFNQICVRTISTSVLNSRDIPNYFWPSLNAAFSARDIFKAMKFIVSHLNFGYVFTDSTCFSSSPNLAIQN